MDKKVRELAALLKLTEAAYSAEQVRMVGLIRQEAKLRTSIEALKPSQLYDSEVSLSAPARRAGADILWQRWADVRRSALNAELARALVAQTQAKTNLAKAFGRNEAIKKLHLEAKKNANVRKARRPDIPS